MGPELAEDPNPIHDALLAWTSWPDYIKETLDPMAVAAATARRSEAAAARISVPPTAQSTDPKFVLLAAAHGEHDSKAGRIHNIDPANRSHTLCGRYHRGVFGMTRILASCPFPPVNGVVEGESRCSSCTRWEEQRSL